MVNKNKIINIFKVINKYLIFRQLIHLTSGNDKSSVDRLISSLSTGENIEFIIQNPEHNQQQLQQEEIRKRKINDCFFSLVNCRLVEASLVSTSRLRQRVVGDESKDETINSKQRLEEIIHKRRSRKIISTKL